MFSVKGTSQTLPSATTVQATTAATVRMFLLFVLAKPVLMHLNTSKAGMDCGVLSSIHTQSLSSLMTTKRPSVKSKVVSKNGLAMTGAQSAMITSPMMATKLLKFSVDLSVFQKKELLESNTFGSLTRMTS